MNSTHEALTRVALALRSQGMKCQVIRNMMQTIARELSEGMPMDDMHSWAEYTTEDLAAVITNQRFITRHAFDPTDCDLMNAAVSMGLLDAISLGCLIATNAADAATILSILNSYAEALQHTDHKLRGEWYALRDAVRYFRTVKPGGEDPFGFKAEALAKATTILARHNVAIPSCGV